jgi:hypothetical protein
VGVVSLHHELEAKMYARVARWEGGDGEALRRSAEEIKAMGPEPPPGVPATGFLMLIDPESGRSMGIGFFETAEDLRQGDEALNAMTPSGDDVGQRVSVERYEVGVDIRR